MKKALILILSLALLLCSAASAEVAEKEEIGVVGVNNLFSIRGRMPEGYRISYLSTDPSAIIATVMTDDPGKPWIDLSIMFNDSYTQDGKGMRLNEVSDEDMALIRESFVENISDAAFDESETALGTKLLIVRGSMGGTDVLDVYTIYESYEIEALVKAVDGGKLTDEQAAMIVDFFSDIDFVPAA